VRNFDVVVEVCKIQVENLRSNVMKNAMMLVCEIFGKPDIGKQILGVRQVSELDFERYSSLLVTLVNLMSLKTTYDKSFIRNIASESLKNVGDNMYSLSGVFTLMFSKLNEKNNTIVLTSIELIEHVFESLIHNNFLNDNVNYVFGMFINLHENPRQQVKNMIKKVCTKLEI